MKEEQFIYKIISVLQGFKVILNVLSIKIVKILTFLDKNINTVRDKCHPIPKTKKQYGFKRSLNLPKYIPSQLWKRQCNIIFLSEVMIPWICNIECILSLILHTHWIIMYKNAYDCSVLMSPMQWLTEITLFFLSMCGGSLCVCVCVRVCVRVYVCLLICVCVYKVWAHGWLH